MIALLLLCISLLFIGFGIYRLRGPVSVWYIAYGIATVEFNYAAIPIGFGLIIWALALSPLVSNEGWQLNLLIIGAIVGFLGVVPGSFFLKPSWLRWLEREHGDIMPLMQQEIEEIGPRNWDQRINNQEELKEWVDDFRRNHGL